MSRQSVLKRTIAGFRFEWEGGEYVEITRVGEPYAFEVINATRADGTLPDFNKAEFMLQIAEFKAGLQEQERSNGNAPRRGGWMAELRHRARETYDA